MEYTALTKLSDDIKRVIKDEPKRKYAYLTGMSIHGQKEIISGMFSIDRYVTQLELLRKIPICSECDTLTKMVKHSIVNTFVANICYNVYKANIDSDRSLLSWKNVEAVCYEFVKNHKYYKYPDMCCLYILYNKLIEICTMLINYNEFDDSVVAAITDCIDKICSFSDENPFEMIGISVGNFYRNITG
jgi:hypothetical protein